MQTDDQLRRDPAFDQDGLYAWRDRFGLLRWRPPEWTPGQDNDHAPLTTH